jgi:hypothetical protein
METATQTSESTSQNLQPDKKVTKSKTAEKSISKNIRINVLKKLDPDSAKLLSAIKDKINKKSVGRKIKDSEIIGLALKQLNVDHIKTLQEMTYQEKDLLQLAHEDYVQVHGRISLNQYLGLLIRGEIKPPIKNVLET